MAEDLAKGRSEIASLLAQRHQLQEWLQRVDTAAHAPAPVRQRVRADYEGRLAEVVTRLRGFSTALTATLGEVQTRVATLEGQETEARDERAEAELRHAVGEYADEEWHRLDRESGDKLERLAAELAGHRGEIVELEEVLRQMQPPEPAPAWEPGGEPEERVEAAGMDAVAPEPLTVVSLDDSPDSEEAPSLPRSRPVEAPRFTPRTGGETRSRERAGPGSPPASPSPPRALRFPKSGGATGTGSRAGQAEEMTFLKSVALEGPGEADDAGSAGGRGGSGKTLKCSDCGAMNRPTEWYCERCGAELAAV